MLSLTQQIVCGLGSQEAGVALYLERYLSALGSSDFLFLFLLNKLHSVCAGELCSLEEMENRSGSSLGVGG